MSEKDIISNNYFKDNERFADLLNGFIFSGQQVIFPEDLQEADISAARIQKMPHEKIKKSQAVIRDVVKYLQFPVRVMLIVLQNQTSIHYAMPVRIMNEEAAEYHAQWRKIAAKHKREKDLYKDEFLSGFSKNDRLNAVISIVLYFGKEPWDGPMNLKEMMDLNEIPSELHEYVTDYPIHILEVHKFDDIQNFRTDLQVVFGFLQNAENKNHLRTYVNEHHQEFENLSQEAYDMISVMSGTSQLRTLKAKYQNTSGGGISVCKAIDDMIEDGKKEGKREGKKEGLNLGIALTKKVFRLNSQGVSTASISQQCDISVEKVLEILDDSDE